MTELTQQRKEQDRLRNEAVHEYLYGHGSVEDQFGQGFDKGFEAGRSSLESELESERSGRIEANVMIARQVQDVQAAESENARLREALKDRDGIIVGLKEMIEGKTKPIEQIRAELEGKKVPSA